MNSNRLNIKVIVSVLVLALVIPFFTTFFEVEASDVRASVNSNISKYGISANASNLTVYVSKNIAVYTNAADANNRTNSTRTYPAGSYSIYKSVDGSMNITRAAGSPGAWINVRDLDKAAAPVATTPSNSTTTTTTTNTSAQTFVLRSSTTTHTNAADAVAGRNSRGTLAAGTYYVYKTHGNAVNVTRTPGVPGSWIKASAGSTGAATTPSTGSTTTTPTTPSTGTTTPAADQVTLKARSNVYSNAADAQSGRNSSGTWGAGTYYVYKTFGSATNITDVKGSPGAWVPNTALTGATTTTPSTGGTTTRPSTGNSIVVDSSKVVLNQSVRVYMNAADAVNQKNSTGTWAAGTYHIYKTAGNAINITRVAGKPGAWIAGGVQVAPATPTTPSTGTTRTPSNGSSNGSTTSTNGNFVLVFDPGHGAGVAHNRGGLLFNEGDQNFIFTEMIRKSAERYANIVTITTRPKNDMDPSFEDRAKAGNGADLYVSIHTNAAAPSVRGVEIWGSNQNTKHAFGNEIVSTWSSTLNTPNRGQKYAQPGKNAPDTFQPVSSNEDPWFIFKGNEAKEKFILESVFHTNMQDSRVFLQNQQNLADKFMDIVAKHFNLKLK